MEKLKQEKQNDDLISKLQLNEQELKIEELELKIQELKRPEYKRFSFWTSALAVLIAFGGIVAQNYLSNIKNERAQLEMEKAMIKKDSAEKFIRHAKIQLKIANDSLKTVKTVYDSVKKSFSMLQIKLKQSNESFTEVIQNLKKDISPNSSTLGKLKEQEKIDKKIQAGEYEEAIKLDPTNVIAYMRFIEQLIAQGAYTKAISYYNPLVSSNQSGVGYSVFPDLIFAYDQLNDINQSTNLVQQLRIRVTGDISKGYGYYSRSQQISWLTEGLQKYLTSFKSEQVKKSVIDLIKELNEIITKLTE